MPDLTIRRVATRRERREFLDLPRRIYRDDPLWIPPLRMHQKEMVGYRWNPFYFRNQIQTFLAWRGGEAIGRIAAILNQGHIQQHNDRRGFFGFFECVDEQPVADALFDAVRVWLAEQGIFNLRGPTNPSLNHELGLLVEGFDSSPFFMMSYNPPYYQKLIEQYGFRKTQDLYAFWGNLEMLPAIQERLGEFCARLIERFNVRLRPLDTRRFREDVETFLSIYNRSLVNTWGFVPMSKDELRHMAAGLQRLIVPELAVAAEIDGNVVGAAFALPDYNPRIKEIDGRLFPFGFIRLLRNKDRIKRIRIISTNVLPEYQLMGIGLTLMHGLVPKGLEWGLEEAEFSWVLESNSLSRGALQKGGAKLAKTYRLYDLDNAPQSVAQPPSAVAQPSSAGLGLPATATVGPASRPACPGQPSSAGSGLPATAVAGAAPDAPPGTATPQSPPPGPAAPQAAAPQGRRPLVLPRPTLPVGRIEIREVRTSRELDQFVRLPWKIYAEDPQWVPPLLKDVKDFLNRRKHPFYRHGDAAEFLALRGGTPVGRILASDDPRYNEHHGTSVGSFGMFECLDDPEASAALLDAAADWLRRRGRSAIMGPIDYSTNYPCGLLIDGFDTPPRVMMNHHRRYYAGLLESWGLVKAKDLYGWWFVDPRDMLSKWRRRAQRLAERGGVVIRPFSLNHYARDVERLQVVYNQSMCNNWGFVKLTDAEFQHLAKRIAEMAVQELILLAEVDDEPVGCCITLPDFNEAIRPLDGRLTRWGLPIGLVRFLYRLRRIKTARMVVLNVLEKYRRRGIAELLILETLDFGKNTLGYTGAELSWTIEDNSLVNRTIAAVGGRQYKTYRIYEKPIAAPGR